MSAEIIQLDRVEQAWERYEDLALQLQANPKLLSDREFQQRMARAFDHWRGLYLAGVR